MMNDTPIEIRHYQSEDRDDGVHLWQLVFPDDPPHNEPNEVIDAKLKVDQLLFVAIDHRKVVGTAMAGYDGHRGWLYSVAVDSAQRRQGLGRRLVAHTVDALKATGCIKVNLQVRAANAPVIAFYEALGFAVEERISMGKLLND